ncbi:MAG: BadF/BadG/BcrA/BcrD ATPase family protein [Eubacteriales bacterium]|nr:BadF/BadG/BcrA/BcrD ATPase family protein [Eubacteriales bacterium]
MKYYLGVDGGGTKTSFTLCDENLNVINEFTGPGCHYLQCGYEGLRAIMAEGLIEVTYGAYDIHGAINPEDIAFAFVGCAGYGDVATDTPLIGDAIRRGLQNLPLALGNDCENALAGALGDRPGINIIAGTGSVGCGKNERGDYVRCGGWHYALGGDEGSGYWISWRLIQEFQRQSDGRDVRTLLYDEVRRILDLDTDDAIVTRVVEEWKLDRTRIAGLAPMVSELAKAGDPHAQEILHDAAAQLAEFALAIYKRLGFDQASGSISDSAAKGDLAKDDSVSTYCSLPVPCSGTGGVFKMGEFITGPFSRILAANGMEYVEPLAEPDIGAVILAIKKSQ